MWFKSCELFTHIHQLNRTNNDAQLLVHEFLAAAIILIINLVALNNKKLLSSNSGCQASRMGLGGLKWRHWQCLIPSGGMGENLFLCLFQHLEVPTFLGLCPASLQSLLLLHIFSSDSLVSPLYGLVITLSSPRLSRMTSSSNILNHINEVPFAM